MKYRFFSNGTDASHYFELLGRSYNPIIFRLIGENGATQGFFITPFLEEFSALRPCSREICLTEHQSYFGLSLDYLENLFGIKLRSASIIWMGRTNCVCYLYEK